ncbi:hypothetical protein M0R04_03640 [Candidatus Dojkabacteria bacterium]|jgi:beta-mannanase|nr:hypothetical protein [Candidatus Dojkabacteria bacterium]
MKNKLKFILLLLLLVGLFSFLIVFRLNKETAIKNWFSNSILPKIETVFEKYISFKTYVSKYKIDDTKRIGVGAAIENDDPTSFKKLLSYEDLIQHKLTYQLIFIAWGDPYPQFPKEFVKGWKDLEITPIITWEPWKRDFVHSTVIQKEYTLQSITDGKHDDYIRQWAKDVKEAEIPIILRFAQEQSTPVGSLIWYPWQGDPSRYIAAFRHIHDIFKQESATNLKYMWSPYANWDEAVMKYYPGNAYVDYVGYTVINHGTDTKKDPTWKSCQIQFVPQYESIDLPNKDVIIVEFGSSENGGDKSQWISDCLYLFQKTPNIVGVVSLEHAQDASTITQWRVNTTQKSLNTFIYNIKNGNFR